MAAKKKIAKKKQCDCIMGVNKKLAEQNGELDTLHFLTAGVTMVRIAVLKKDKDDKRKPIKNIAPHFCPFCGQKYPELS